MVVQFQTSFAPKKAPAYAPIVRRTGGHSVNIFAIISIIVFIITVGLAVTVFFYKSHLVSAIGEMDVSLAAARKSFEPEFIAEASRLNARIEAARALLGTHLAVSPFFDILEKKTLENVRFTEFSFSVVGKMMQVSMTGQAKSFNSVALQSDVFGAEHAFVDPVFGNFTLDDEGNVIFSFEAKIDPDLLLYGEGVVKGKASDDAESASELLLDAEAQ